jgi:hypothetical protein
LNLGSDSEVVPIHHDQLHILALFILLNHKMSSTNPFKFDSMSTTSQKSTSDSKLVVRKEAPSASAKAADSSDSGMAEDSPTSDSPLGLGMSEAAGNSPKHGDRDLAEKMEECVIQPGDNPKSTSMNATPSLATSTSSSSSMISEQTTSQISNASQPIKPSSSASTTTASPDQKASQLIAELKRALQHGDPQSEESMLLRRQVEALEKVTQIQEFAKLWRQQEDQKKDLQQQVKDKEKRLEQLLEQKEKLRQEALRRAEHIKQVQEELAIESRKLIREQFESTKEATGPTGGSSDSNVSSEARCEFFGEELE